MNKSGFYLQLLFMALTLYAPIVVTIPDILAQAGTQTGTSIFGISLERAFFFKIQVFVVSVAILVYWQILRNELVNPGLKLEAARAEILDTVLKPSVDDLFNQTDKIRIMIHQAKRQWLKLGLWFKLEPSTDGDLNVRIGIIT